MSKIFNKHRIRDTESEKLHETEFSKKVEKDMEMQPAETSVMHRLGILLSVFGVFFVFCAILSMYYMYENKLWELLLIGVGFCVFGGILKSDKVSGVFATKEFDSNNNMLSSTKNNYRKNVEGVINMIDTMDGHEFEFYCAELLNKMEFYNVSVTKGSGDQGVDIIATKDGIKYAIQCKNYASPLSNKPIQEVCAGKVFYGCQIGAVMTNSTFTTGAIELANATGTLLWDRTVLKKMISETI